MALDKGEHSVLQLGTLNKEKSGLDVVEKYKSLSLPGIEPE
jgi:hypothetical protein